MSKQKVDYGTFRRAKNSVRTRIARLRSMRSGYWGDTRLTPIQEIGVFADEMDTLENTLKSMENRLSNATITVEL